MTFLRMSLLRLRHFKVYWFILRKISVKSFSHSFIHAYYCIGIIVLIIDFLLWFYHCKESCYKTLHRYITYKYITVYHSYSPSVWRLS